MEYNSVSFAAYLSAAIVAGLLTLTYAFQLLKRQKTWIFTSAALVHTLHLAALALSFSSNPLPVYLVALAEFLHFNVWVFCIAFTIKRDANRKQLPTSLQLLFTSGIPITALGMALLLIAGLDYGYLYIWFSLGLAVISLVSVEQLYRYSAENDRQIKLLCMNLGAIFLYDIYLFTQALIFAGLDPQLWQSRAAVSIATCLFMALGGLLLLQRNERPANFNLSRPIAFYTTSLVAVGILITVLSLGGYYVRLYGGNWGTVFYTLLLAGAVLSITTVFISSRIRMRLSVLINKHLFRYKYDYRNEWLRLINYLAQPAEAGEVNQRAFQAVASVTRAPSGAIWLKKQGFYEPVYRANLPSFVELQEEPVNSPFCQAFLDSEWVFIPDSGDNEALSQHNELLPQWAHNIPDLWLLFPLIVGEELVGFIALTKPPGDEALTWEDLDLLKTMGRQIASYLKRHQQAEQLAEGKQFDTYNKLVAFIIHDLNNLIAQQALVVRNAEKHKGNPAFIEDAISTISNSVDRMNNLLKKLRRDESDLVKRLSILEVVQQAINECQRNSPKLTSDLEFTKRTINADQVRLVMTITNFIKNAQEATPDNGRVHVTLQHQSDWAIITIEDSGSGMDWDFIHNRLFKPFETTKSGKGMGIGVYLSREYISELSGTLNVVSAPGEGTTITISLPLNKDSISA
ncbi:XrtA/PEP-CTERM system histidine kinase PrsK [Cellvibrio japonicus]|uniref:histidine kinase n=1 Tax=Cellvibrio japonicus (strain Ueda107) TaxID=498211 RepID=B3PF84_CELJU|nr:XrtA/PEP-CTERM system histidine kinase PrsK [Cellvibrio japonicus]ACE85111.1 putative PEP-CTERM system histidine kinase [Cellvibrio japonicus Ueda107]QEI13635.1 PEP-CTERM system histidine kinase PrsK [Cellvibrio japonicus]QEI17208.1 PEP-CTERM system histidine kinase PrsK [Cellvibrio japonicus]QEI20786.1 PEP-CTERM system histidine kinase PrsK [Cellvibrio japonicus]